MHQVHNGIEYGDMQMIGECYDIMKVSQGGKVVDNNFLLKDGFWTNQVSPTQNIFIFTFHRYR